MDSIKINTGIKRIVVNDDPTRVITFNPTDVSFAERFYGLLKDFEKKQGEYKTRAEAIEAETEMTAEGIPVNLSDRLSLLREICEYVRGQIDHLFGAGTSEAAFGDALSLDMFTQFFDGIIPFVQTARDEKLKQYTNTVTQKRRVMK